MLFVAIAGGFLVSLGCAALSAALINSAHSDTARERIVTTLEWVWPIIAVVAFLLSGTISGFEGSAILLFLYVPIGLVGIYMWVCDLIAEAAEKKGRNRSHFLWLTTLIGPIIAGILVALMHDRGEISANQYVPMQQETKLCPMCAEPIRLEARKCRYCGEWLEIDVRQGEPSE